MGGLLLAPHVKGLVHHDEAHAVAQVEQLGGGRVVRTADAVAAHLLQYLQLALDGTGVDRRAQAAQVVVHAHAVYLDVLPVEEEAFLRIKLEGADAEGCVVDVGHLPVGQHRGAHGVPVGVLQAPQRGIVEGKLLHGLCLGIGTGLEGRGCGLGHDVALGIDQLGAELQGGGLTEGVVHRGAHGEAGMVLGHLVGCDVGAPLCHVYGLKLAQPHVAINAAAGVPARVGLLGIVHPHGQHVFSSPLDVGREVVAEGDVSVGTGAQLVAVEVDGAVHVHAVEVYVEAQALVGLVGGEGLAIPAHASGQCASARARGVLAGEVALDGPVVGQVEATPRGVVVGGSGSVGHIAQLEGPVGGEVLTAIVLLSGGAGGRAACAYHKQQGQGGRG